MPHVVTQSCVGDGSCVYACPVNCIQPTPDDPAFELAEMLHIDPATCVDCGACVKACPVEAIKPHHKLAAEEVAFELINARYHEQPRKRALLAPVRPRLVVRDRGEPLRVAIVGSGPAAMYAAEEVLTVPGAQVSMYERLETPYGLVKAGVAPDHRRTRRITRQLDRIRASKGLTMHLGVEVGRDVTVDELLASHHAVVFGVGAAADRKLQVPGAELPGALSATQIVGWYNGHPDHSEHTVDLTHKRAVVIGNGNVALDVARILTTDPELLADTDISTPALEALRGSAVEEVVVAARGGAERSAFTLPELVGLTGVPGVSVRVEPGALDGLPEGDPKLDMLRSLPPVREGDKLITLRYGLSPAEVRGDEAVSGVGFENGEVLDTGLLVTSIGYRGLPVAGLPFDDERGTVPNDEGRVSPGIYVVGWIKRGPRGFIGTNRGCAQDTVAALFEDYNAGALGAGGQARAA